MLTLSNQEEENYQGFVTDGVIGCFLSFENGAINHENFYKVDGEALDRIIQNILQVKLIALNSRNLVDGLCNPPENDGIAFQLMNTLYKIINNNIHPKTQMLFNEWKQLFNLAHDDISKQQAIINRKQSLESLFHKKFSGVDEEYMALFALQTAYAIIVKILAFKVISQARYKKSLINFYKVISLDSDALRMQMEDLENGAIFIDYGITNLLEGDFFSWYVNKEQWTNELYDCLISLFIKLSKYSDSVTTTSTKKAQDFFKELYQSMVPSAVRHSLGEYYTKKWLAKKVIDEALLKCPSRWTSLDPCCGSGTFISVLIDKVLEESSGLPNEEKVKQVLSRVKGIDLNPIASLTARVNYFINIARYVEEIESFEIPIYLGDSSYVPQKVKYENIDCLQYTINTLQNPINVLVPSSMVSDNEKFSFTMSRVETYIKNLDTESIYNIFCSICNPKDLVEATEKSLHDLAEQLVELEKRKWNGIWARILTNFLTTANMGKFDLIVGNPPWVDWKSLPSGYRERIKGLCISRKLFSGDSVTGGINLNICALITNVVAQNWLSSNGIIAFLMPEPLVFQQSYEGFRNLIIEDENTDRLYFYKFSNWNSVGHPFKPVTQKFLTYFVGHDVVDYRDGVNVDCYYKKNKRDVIDDLEVLDFEKTFDVEHKFLATCHEDKNFFTYVDSKEEAYRYQKLAGTPDYIGREGIEFYPQELMVFHLSDIKGGKDTVVLENMQNPKSKYSVPQRTVLLEKAMLRPMIKGKDITHFHVETDNYIVPFPYSVEDPKVPIKMDKLIEIAPKLAKYYQDNRHLFEEQTGYSDRIIGRKDAGYYALARVGAYSYAKNYVVFRDNTKWCASVVSEIDTSWGGLKVPVFQNHCASICEDSCGNFITYDEAHYICGIMNSYDVYKYMMTSSDSRSFPIRPRIKIPKYDDRNLIHKEISSLSKEAHKFYFDKEKLHKIVSRISELYSHLV